MISIALVAVGIACVMFAALLSHAREYHHAVVCASLGVVCFVLAWLIVDYNSARTCCDGVVEYTHERMK